jgi:uncharacterized protein with FMN-binding domain
MSAPSTMGRNVTVLAGTAVAAGLVMLYPTSTNSGGQGRHGQGVAPVGVVAASSGVASGTVNGTSAGTRYGPVQVQITVVAGKVTKATAIDYPQASGRDQEINRIAIPQLNAEALKVQNAQIDTVSGATYTSDGYRRSLQAALDAAHLS